VGIAHLTQFIVALALPIYPPKIMCLAIPGELLQITNPDALQRTGAVSFGGVVKSVNLAFVPEVTVGDFVVVHVGFAISKLDTKQAEQVFADWEAIEQVSLGRPT
jgi:hydrogenase expression/formation protein HypC